MYLTIIPIVIITTHKNTHSFSLPTIISILSYIKTYPFLITRHTMSPLIAHKPTLLLPIRSTIKYCLLTKPLFRTNTSAILLQYLCSSSAVPLQSPFRCARAAQLVRSSCAPHAHIVRMTHFDKPNSTKQLL
jgi:hypothetical protein